MHDQHNVTFCLNSDYSTTRLVTREKPIIVNRPEDAFETVLFLPEGANRTGQGGLRTQGLFKRSLPDKPLITVITVVLNGAKHLEETILSVLNQTYDNVEYIVIDGGSTDGTLEIIKKYEWAIDYWVSEKDEGIYDAMNKGLSIATGYCIGLLNSDDFYENNALCIIHKYITCPYNFDFIFGCVFKDKIKYSYNPWKILYTFRFYTSHSAGFFIKFESQKQIGLYNIEYKYSADYDLFYRMIVTKKMKGISTLKNELIGNFRLNGFSSKVIYIEHLFEETRIRLNNNQNRFFVLAIFIFRYLKNIKKI